MTSYYMERYLKNQTFYKIQSQSLIDNPDQRIVDDLSSFTGTALSFSLTVFNAAVDLISFSNILYGIYPPLFVVLLVYSLGGTAISVFLGKVIFLFSWNYYFEFSMKLYATENILTPVIRIYLSVITGTGKLKFFAREERSRFSLWTCTHSWECWINCILWWWGKWIAASAAAVQECLWKFNCMNPFFFLYAFPWLWFHCLQSKDFPFRMPFSVGCFFDLHISLHFEW